MPPDLLGRARDRILASRRLVIMSAVVALALAGAAGAVASLDASPARPIAPGDSVTLLLTAYDAEGRVVFTNDAEIARAALAEGNAFLSPDLEDSPYGARTLVVPAERKPDPGAEDARFQLTAFLVGAREGDTVHTPLMVRPFGMPLTYQVPRVIGPVDLEFTFDLAEMYDEEHREASLAKYGPREAFVPGAVVPYNLLGATVVAVDGDVARLRVEPREGDKLPSEKLGFDVVVRAAEGGLVTLHPDLALGQVFETQGCELPLRDLPPGRFRVVDVGPENATVEAAPRYLEHLQDATLRFEIDILDVEHASTLEAARLWFATRIDLPQSQTTDKTPTEETS